MVKGKNIICRTMYNFCLSYQIFSFFLSIVISVVEFSRRDDMKYALKELDNEKLNGSRVTLEEAVSSLKPIDSSIAKSNTI